MAKCLKAVWACFLVACGVITSPLIVTANADNSRVWGQQFQSQVEKCWRKPRPVNADVQVEAVFAIRLDRDGKLTARPVPEANPSSDYAKAYQQSAFEALLSCQPYKLPVEYYEEWKYFAPVFKEVARPGSPGNGSASRQPAVSAEQLERSKKIDSDDSQHLLTRTYFDYITLKKCFEKRDGYLAVNISGQEMESARKTAKAIEEILEKKKPDLNKDSAWKAANADDDSWKADKDKLELLMLGQYDRNFKIDLSDRNRCQNTLAAFEERLKRLSPESEFIKKDF